MKEVKNNLWQKIKDFYHKFDVDFKEKFLPGYYFNKKIMRVALVIMLLVAVGIMWEEDFDFSDHVTYNCPVDSVAPCENPFRYENYETFSWLECPDPDVCKYDFVMPGQTIGEPIPPGVKYFSLFVFFLMAAAFLVNHLVHNRGYKFRGVKFEGFDNDEG